MEGTRIRRNLRKVVSSTKDTPLWVLLSFTLCLSCGSVVAFSATPPPPPPPSSSPAIHHAFIELVDLVALHKADTKLPASFIDTWPTWIFQADGDKTSSFTKIPDDEGFVSPSSTDTLYQPLDLKAPTCTLALGFHIRDGTIRHVFPALDIGYNDEQKQPQQQHRNRGLCSVPRAYKWIEYSLGLAGEWHTFGLQAQIRKVPPQGGEDEGGWQSRACVPPGTSVLAKAIDQLQYALAEDPPAELGEGSHIIHALLPGEDGTNNCPISFEQPMSGHEICVTLCDDDDDEQDDLGDTRIVVAPTALLQQQNSDPTTSSGGILHVQVEATMAGSESEYLPEAYKPLYHDLDLRNPRYQQYQERRKEGSIPTTNKNE